MEKNLFSGNEATTGVIIKFPREPKKKELLTMNNNMIDFLYYKMKETADLGFKFFLIELTKEDFLEIDFQVPPSKKIDYICSMVEKGHRVGFYNRTGSYLTDEKVSLKTAIREISICQQFLNFLSPHRSSQFPIIVHIGGSHGDRKKTLVTFCENFKKHINDPRICVINDEKPSLFSVKDLLSGTFYQVGTPIVFRSASHKTNQGNLTSSESLLLASSTWPRAINPVMIYIPQDGDSLSDDQTKPYGIPLDIIYDNKIPEPA